MPTFTAPFDGVILYLIAASLVVILTCWVVLQRRVQRMRQEAANVAAAVHQFFRAIGANVTVQCIGARPQGRIVVIDAGSSKRFRYWHVVESILAEYIRERCALSVDKVYWRFPINEARDAPDAAKVPAPAGPAGKPVEDQRYEDAPRSKTVPGYEVAESSLEKYQEFVRQRMAQLAAEPGSARAPEPALI